MNNKIESREIRELEPIGGTHGVSAIFPKFQDIIDYEEKRIILQQGYPRFVTHPFIKNIEQEYKHLFNCLDVFAFHNYKVAVFIVVDYFYRNYERIFSNKGFSKDIYSLLENKFHLNKSTPIKDAEVLFLDIKSIENKYINKKERIICLFSECDNKLDKIIDNVDLIVINDKKYNVGLILSFKEEYSLFNLLRRYSGFIVSSRKLKQKKIPNIEKISRYTKSVKERISALENTSSQNCFLYPSGMAAIFTSILSILSPEKPNFIALGSLYVDTIRILEKWVGKYNLNNPIFITKDIIANLEKYINNKTAGIILEIPSNPLIQIIDIEKVVNIAHEYGCKVIVDSTIASPYNIKPFDYNVDIIVHSTTKFLSGENNHIGGIILTNNENIKKKIDEFNKILKLDMFISEIKILNNNLKNFEKRMEIINSNSNKIAHFLANHKAIKHVYYPSLENNPNYLLMKKYLKGGSGLISFTFKNSTYETAEKFYNNLTPPILKGPSLGSESTLLSPYVVMAHYDDSKENLKKLGLDFYLMRISVGIEPSDQIINSLEQGLNAIH